MPFNHTDKKSGDLIASKDWNDAMNEIIRLNKDKLNVSGGAISGPLKIGGQNQQLLPLNSAHTLQIGDTFTFHDGGSKFIGINVWYDPDPQFSTIKYLTDNNAACEIRLDQVGTLSLKTWQKGTGILADKKGVNFLPDGRLETAGSISIRGTDLILSGRTNKDGRIGQIPGETQGTNYSPCRALVDWNNKLVINWGKDFKDGTFIWGDGNTLALLGETHCYIEFYPESKPNNFSSPTQFKELYRKAYIGFPDKGSTELVISSEFFVNGKSTVRIAANNVFRLDNAASFNTTSDINLKKNIKKLEGCLDTLLKLEGVKFDWIDPERFGKKQDMGFVAQTVEKVVPEWVGENSDGIKYLSMSGFDAMVVEAIRELKHEIESVKSILKEK